MQFLSQTTQTAYATLQQKVLDSRYTTLNHLNFVSKRVKEKLYWYCQYTDISGSRKQRYIGADSETTQKVISSARASMQEQDTMMRERKRLVAIVIAGGGHAEKGMPARIMEKLSDAGVFDAGGMLIGSYAFSTYGNMLGVTLQDSMMRTEDMDMAYERSLEIGFVRDIREDITQADSTLTEPKQINPWVPPYEMIAPNGFKLEFLTSRTSPPEKSPIEIPRFGINAMPLEFLDFLMKEPVKTVVLYGSGILVNVPNPARYAVHKLAVSQMRLPNNVSKVTKDLQQASTLLSILLSDNPGSLLLACDDLNTRGDMLPELVKRGLKYLPDQEIAKRFEAEILS